MSIIWTGIRSLSLKGLAVPVFYQIFSENARFLGPAPGQTGSRRIPALTALSLVAQHSTKKHLFSSRSKAALFEESLPITGLSAGLPRKLGVPASVALAGIRAGSRTPSRSLAKCGSQFVIRRGSGLAAGPAYIFISGVRLIVVNDS
ncbi:MAG: hypothetical protein AB1330_12775 [Bacillota bacterium]